MSKYPLFYLLYRFLKANILILVANRHITYMLVLKFQLSTINWGEFSSQGLKKSVVGAKLLKCLHFIIGSSTKNLNYMSLIAKRNTFMRFGYNDIEAFRVGREMIVYILLCYLLGKYKFSLVEHFIITFSLDTSMMYCLLFSLIVFLSVFDCCCCFYLGYVCVCETERMGGINTVKLLQVIFWR